MAAASARLEVRPESRSRVGHAAALLNVPVSELVRSAVEERAEPLDPARPRLDSLDSGEPQLDTWLREQAAGAQARRVARTFVWCETADDQHAVLGYYSLTGHRRIRDGLPTSLGRGSPAEIPRTLRLVQKIGSVAAALDLP